MLGGWWRQGLPLDLGPSARRPSTGAIAPRLGVEHELCVWDGPTQVDFRTLLPVVAPGLRTLDPGDPRARRLPSGVVLTADGREAELATPPLRWGPETVAELDRLLARERAELAGRVAAAIPGSRLTGFSTHVNVEVPDSSVSSVAERFAHTCGLATAVVGEPRSSAGLLVRARRNRLEVGGEYAEGERLVALVTFVAAAVVSLLAGDSRVPGIGPRPRVLPARERYGWFLPPEEAYADVLVADAQDAREQLARVWEWARPACGRSGVDPAPVDALVSGGLLRRDDPQPPTACTTIGPPVGAAARPTASGAAQGDEPFPGTGPRLLAGGVTAETLWSTWTHVVWVFEGHGGALHAVVPAGEEMAFLRRLDRGGYDAVVRRELRRKMLRRRLLVHRQLVGAAWWHEVRPGALVPAERAPDGSLPRVSWRRAARHHRAELMQRSDAGQ